MTLDPEAVQASWERIVRHGDLVPLRFYETLFMVHPELEALFPKRMGPQRDHLVTAVNAVVRSLKALEAMIPTLEALGRRHATFASPEQYTWVGNALVATLEKFDPQWDDQLAEQWSEAYDTAADIMLDAASKLRTVVDPSPQWYTIERKERQREWVQMMLAAYPTPIDIGTRHVWITPDGIGGLWRPYELIEGAAHPDDLQTRTVIVVQFEVADIATRAMAARPVGSRAAVAPLLMEDTNAH